MNYTEDQLENAAIEIFQEMGYEYVLGPNLTDRKSNKDVILEDRFRDAVYRLNKEIPNDCLEEVIKNIINPNSPLLIENNKIFHKYINEGVNVVYRDKEGNDRGDHVYLFDFGEDSSINNDFLVVNQLTVEEHRERRPDLVVFINGLPVSVIELKTASNENVSINDAYLQLQTYKEDIPSLFSTNAFMVISDGIFAKSGTLTSNFERFMHWKSVDGKEINNGALQMETLLLGMFDKNRILDIIKNFVLFQDDGKHIIKILAGYHQYYAVKKAVSSTDQAINGDKKAGLIWHTQGSGKSLSMVFYAAELIRKLGNNPTIVVLTDRNDLDKQLFGTFSNSKDVLRQTPIQIENRKDLRDKLNRESGGIIFTTIQKFSPGEDEDNNPMLCGRDNIILIADEAHRSQYGIDAKLDKKTGKVSYGYAKHIRDALPNATFIGFTGTPVESSDKSTRGIFGNEIDVYDMTQSVEDGATVKIYYENRIARLSLNDNILSQIDKKYEKLVSEGAEEVLIEKSKKQLSRMEQLIGDEDRLELVANDLVAHYEDREQVIHGKAMIVCQNREIAAKMYEAIIKIRPDWQHDDLDKGKIKVVITDSVKDEGILKKHKTTKQQREDLANRMKDNNDELKIVIVVDMWLTGFDVPSMDTMYVDKAMQGHNLMQAIARVNRVFKGKEGGLVVDYIGIMAYLREALNIYTKRDRNQVELDLNAALAKLKENIEKIRDIFHGFDYSIFFDGSDRDRMNIIANGTDFVLDAAYGEEHIKKDFIKFVSELSAAETLCRSMISERDKLEIAYFKAIKSCLVKVSGKDISLDDINERVIDMVKASIQKDTIIDLNAILGIKQGELDLFNEEFIHEIQNMKRKNIALEMLKKLLAGKIKGLQKTSIVQSEEFSKKMKELMNKYNNKAITNAEVIEELIKMSRDIRDAIFRGEELGLSIEEMAFYEALGRFGSAKEVMGEDVLKDMAKELTDLIKKSRTVDWDRKDSARAKLRSLVKRLLRRYDYPPDYAIEALQLVIAQAEKMAANINL